ncbi:GPI anchored protein [Venturia nashicola]|uniref:GPI anchored protein n=1 Tax=Venturia nashicola TaxID=86259 RepID=A0A4Z1NZH1_9PEZI|nr:GPI anchored protein [Venturia nashicola]TLD20031.1 GPI anchored protein [Venturia nashicola]
MLFFTTIILSLIPLTAAQSTSTVNLFLLNTDPQQLVASVITANPTTTQYLLTCPSSVDSNDCGYRPGVTVGVRSGSIYGASITNTDFTLSYECTVYTSGTSSAVCTESMGGSEANFPGVESATLNGTDIAFFPATVTAGLDKLTGTASGSGTKATSTGTAKTSGSSSGSLVALSGTASETGSASRTTASGATATSSSGAGKVGIGGVLRAGAVLALGLAVM